MSTLVLAEHDGAKIRTATRSAIAIARELTDAGGQVLLLVLGNQLDSVAANAACFGTTIVADSPLLAVPRADAYARVIADVCKSRKIKMIVAASTSVAKDTLPRVAALLEAAMVSDVMAFTRRDGELYFQRPMYAGAVTATVKLVGWPRIITLRASAFSPAATLSQRAVCESWVVDASTAASAVQHLGVESRTTHRPDLTEARVVVSGGRAFRNKEEFEQCVGGLADALGGATGCTRALVDSGIAPNEWQVGQTGRIVSPDLYIALGISGAVQHLAGMKSSRVIVAINRDSEAPLFSIADYGLVGDVHEIVPQLIAELAKDRG